MEMRRMNLLRYTLACRSSITEWQENMLIGHLQSMLEMMEKKLKGAKNSFLFKAALGPLMRYNPALSGLIQSRIEWLLIEVDGVPNFRSYFKLEKKDDKTYMFYAPDPHELYGVADITKYIPNLRGTDTTTRFLKTTAQDMKLKDGEYKITVSKEDDTLVE
jgi:hypothetical protein